MVTFNTLRIHSKHYLKFNRLAKLLISAAIIFLFQSWRSQSLFRLWINKDENKIPFQVTFVQLMHSCPRFLHIIENNICRFNIHQFHLTYTGSVFSWTHKTVTVLVLEIYGTQVKPFMTKSNTSNFLFSCTKLTIALNVRSFLMSCSTLCKNEVGIYDFYLCCYLLL